MTTKRLLIVEDDFGTRELLKRTLINADFDVSAVGDAPEALRYIQRNGLPHLALIDLGLPTMHGFDLSKRIKEMGDVPIVFITADADEESKVLGIAEYAEDYLVKPINPRELTVRIRRILSRIPDLGYATHPIVIIDEHVSIDFANSRVMVDGLNSELTPIEARLLWILVNNAGHVVRTDQLIERVWRDELVLEDVLRVNVSRLRRKLKSAHQETNYIQNERGLGYRFVALQEQ